MTGSSRSPRCTASASSSTSPRRARCGRCAATLTTSRAADHWAPSAERVRAVRVRPRNALQRPIRRGSPRQLLVDLERAKPAGLARTAMADGEPRPGARFAAAVSRLHRDAPARPFGQTGHLRAGDTILIGELAPEGYSTPGSYTAMTPIPFIQALFCLDRELPAAARQRGSRARLPTQRVRPFVRRRQPALFDATGFAHHPYDFFHLAVLQLARSRLRAARKPRPPRANARPGIRRLRGPPADPRVPDRVRLSDEPTRPVPDLHARRGRRCS